MSVDSPLGMGKIDKSDRNEEEFGIWLGFMGRGCGMGILHYPPLIPSFESDALSSLEREVLKRTHQAQQALLRQRVHQTTTPGSTGVHQSLGGRSSHVQQLQQQLAVNAPRSQQPQIVLQSNSESVPQLHYSTASSGSNSATRLLVAETNQQQQQSLQQPVAYMPAAAHQPQRA